MKCSRLFKLQLVINKILKLIPMNLRHVKSIFMNSAYHIEKENKLSVTLVIPTEGKSYISSKICIYHKMSEAHKTSTTLKEQSH